MKSYQAWAKGNFRITRDTPRAAALAFFQTWPTKRKCSITEGVSEGIFFTVTYTYGNPPKRWKDVTSKTAATLPEAP